MYIDPKNSTDYQDLLEWAHELADLAEKAGGDLYVCDIRGPGDNRPLQLAPISIEVKAELERFRKAHPKE